VRVLLSSKDNSDNVDTFVKQRLNSVLVKGFTAAGIDPVQYFHERHEGMFLWVKIMLKYLATMDSHDDLKEILHNSPQEINGVYQKIFERLCQSLNKYELRWVKEIIAWTVVSKRDLTLAEIAWAIPLSRQRDSATVLDIEATLSKCGAILQVVDSDPSANSKTVRLVHDTFKEFIINPQLTRSERWPDHVNVQTSHSQVAFLCLRCLLGKGDAVFNDYAEKFWIDHLSQAERSGDMATRLLSDLHRFCTSKSLAVWIRGLLRKYSVSDKSRYEFEEPSWSCVLDWLNGLKGLDKNKDQNLSASLRWRRSVLSTNTLAEDIGKAAISVWLSDDLEEFAYVTAAFRLALKYFQREASPGDPHDLHTDLCQDEFRPMAKWADVHTYDKRNIGIAYASLRMPRDAINYYLLSSDKNKESPILWEYVGHMHHAIGEIKEEIKAYKTATEKDPNRFQSFVYLACAYKFNGEMQNAKVCCNSKAIGLKPEIKSWLCQYLGINPAQEETPAQEIIWRNDFIPFVTQPPWNLKVA
jgi:tetratricopeptide (TPR) repeat protein